MAKTIKSKWFWVLTLNLMLIAVFTIISVHSMGLFSVVAPEQNEIVLIGEIDSHTDKHLPIMIGDEQISFEGDNLAYSGKEEFRVKDDFFQLKDSFTRTIRFRGMTYTLHPYETMDFNYFSLTYLPKSYSITDETDEFIDRFLLTINPNGLMVDIDKNIESKKIGDPLILKAVITNNLFEGINGGIEYKVSSLGLFQQTVSSVIDKLTIGKNGYVLAMSNDDFGKKTLELNKIIIINGKSYKIDLPERFNFRMDRDGITNLVTNETYNYLVGNESTIVLPEEATKPQLNKTWITAMSIISVLVTAFFTYIFFRRKK